MGPVGGSWFDGPAAYMPPPPYTAPMDQAPLDPDLPRTPAGMSQNCNCTVEDVTTVLLINSDRLLVYLFIINFCPIKMAVFIVLAEAKAAEAAASSTATTFAPMRVYLPEVSSLTC